MFICKPKFSKCLSFEVYGVDSAIVNEAGKSFVKTFFFKLLAFPKGVEHPFVVFCLEFSRSCSCVLFKEANEIINILKAAFLCHLGKRVILCFQIFFGVTEPYGISVF